MVIFLSGALFAEKGEDLSYQIDSTVFRSGLKNGESKFYFSFKNIPIKKTKGLHEKMNQSIRYGYNGNSKTVVLGAKNEFEVSVTPGTYSFQFYYSNEYYEISTQPMVIESRYKTFVSCYLKIAEYAPVQCEKPVIYLYPEKPTLVEVQIVPKGELQFTYPAYENGWNLLADPTGNLTISGNSYNYLFWESALPTNMVPFDKHNGFIVERTNVVEFLEEKLSTFGLNTKEQADFITYWGPQLMRNPKNFVHFVFNEQCNDFAELSISPKPDHIYRIYIVFTSNFDEEKLIYKEQVVPHMQRNGFTVIEWGGSNLSKENFEQTELN